MMRKLVYDLLIAQSVLTDQVPAVRWYEEGAVIDTPLARPFVILKTTGTSRNVGRFTTLEIWVYDDRGSYTKIDNFLRTLRSFLDTAAESSRTRSDGSVVRLVTTDWQGDSADLYDDIFRCGTRYGSWRLIGAGQ